MLLGMSCASTSSVSDFAGSRGVCTTDPQLAGEWHNRRTTQLGPATMTIELGLDCRYSTRISSLLGKFAERGEYRIEDGHLVFSRSNGETSWPYVLDGDRLRLTEAENEVHEYRRVTPRAAPPR
jgi:hypothetical protein